MKAIKNLCLFCFLIFGILMQSEIFQDQLWNFSTAYFTSSRYEVASEDMSQFLKDVSETATENDVHIFSQYNEINNKYLSTHHFYHLKYSSILQALMCYIHSCIVYSKKLLLFQH